MTNKEAIETLKCIEAQVNEYGFNGTLHMSCEKYGVIKSALEYRTPKKPICDEYRELYFCPACKRLQGYDLDDFSDFCPNCGQAIDWT